MQTKLNFIICFLIVIILPSCSRTGIVGSWQLESLTSNGKSIENQKILIKFKSDSTFIHTQGDIIRSGRFFLEKGGTILKMQIKKFADLTILYPAEYDWIYKIEVVNKERLTLLELEKNKEKPIEKDSTERIRWIYKRQ